MDVSMVSNKVVQRTIEVLKTEFGLNPSTAEYEDRLKARLLQEVAKILDPTPHGTRQPVTSSNIAAVGYNATQKLLEVEFHSGAVYQYFEVPQDVYDGFMAAESKGRYFSKSVKTKFNFGKVARD